MPILTVQPIPANQSRPEPPGFPDVGDQPRGDTIQGRPPVDERTTRRMIAA